MLQITRQHHYILKKNNNHLYHLYLIHFSLSLFPLLFYLFVTLLIIDNNNNNNNYNDNNNDDNDNESELTSHLDLELFKRMLFLKLNLFTH